MKLAIPHWQSRVSPVCDEARRFLVVEIVDNLEVRRDEFEMMPSGSDPVGRASQLRQWGVTTLICGAISRTLEVVLQGAGIQVIPKVCGCVEEVLQTFRAGALDQERYGLPGCARRQQRRRAGPGCARRGKRPKDDP